ncbi:DNA cytosine methyltransferase [Mesorhizobium sp. BR1-1-3]|uniref:DNA cytosine methyltransferase n=1 Tax=Mesorhizobium sp. BR1-1-3 TaxID=2876651 RepID=UPI001CD191A8|nr:DNA cytosine methyltransferase [Mesorhizobium sp. BR1-1-3]MBZ9892304.1 DNA cytosine methyltransferase [Mesorhizobium sp. BR1-1-3]
MRFVSLYSGGGGLDLGLERAGFKPALGLDASDECAETYRQNFRGTPFIKARISEVTKERLLESIGRDEIDLLAGGPPCPPFSKSRFYRKEKPRGLDDPNGWETIDGYLNVLEWVRPRAFLLENVKGLSYKVHSDALKVVVDRARGLGYRVAVQVLNAADYGVPQIRERCFVLGMLDRDPTFPAPTHSNDPASGLKPWATAGAVLADLDTDENASDVGHFAGGRHHHLLREVPPGDNYLYLTEKRGHPTPHFEWRKRYWSFLLKLSPDQPSWTIQARRSNNMGPFHWRNRILRIGEIKRLQTFPDAFAFAGTVEEQWRQIGNAVPPALAESLGRQLAGQLASRMGRAA